jgi:toxin secretion/phage lysis holin
MEHVKELKLAIASAFATVFYLIGWQGYLFLLLVAAMVIDYITGSVAARKNNEWTSAKATEGRQRKALTFAAIIVAIILDSAIWIIGSVNPVFNLPIEWPFVFTFVSAFWFLFSEAGSALENLIICGLNLPTFLIKGIKILKGKTEAVGDKLLSENTDE